MVLCCGFLESWVDWIFSYLNGMMNYTDKKRADKPVIFELFSRLIL
jgi:hypothetical protein